MVVRAGEQFYGDIYSVWDAATALMSVLWDLERQRESSCLQSLCRDNLHLSLLPPFWAPPHQKGEAWRREEKAEMAKCGRLNEWCYGHSSKANRARTGKPLNNVLPSGTKGVSLPFAEGSSQVSLQFSSLGTGPWAGSCPFPPLWLPWEPGPGPPSSPRSKLKPISRKLFPGICAKEQLCAEEIFQSL